MCSSGGCPQTPDTNNTKGAKAKRSIGKAIMTIKDGNQRGPPPKKMINVNGIMKMNPEYTKWKAGASAPTESEVAHAETDATGIPMVAATFATAEDSSAAYKAPTGAEPQATTTITTTTYTTPPPQQYPPQNAGHAPVYHNKSLGGRPAQITCPNCHRQATTRTTEVIGTGTIVAIVLLLVFFWPLFWLPLVIPDCKQIDHFCSLCHAKVGETPSSCCDC